MACPGQKPKFELHVHSADRRKASALPELNCCEAGAAQMACAAATVKPEPQSTLIGIASPPFQSTAGAALKPLRAAAGPIADSCSCCGAPTCASSASVSSEAVTVAAMFASSASASSALLVRAGGSSAAGLGSGLGSRDFSAGAALAAALSAGFVPPRPREHAAPATPNGASVAAASAACRCGACCKQLQHTGSNSGPHSPSNVGQPRSSSSVASQAGHLTHPCSITQVPREL